MNEHYLKKPLRWKGQKTLPTSKIQDMDYNNEIIAKPGSMRMNSSVDPESVLDLQKSIDKEGLNLFGNIPTVFLIVSDLSS